MVEPLVSVIIPTYNRSDCILNAVQSASQQTYKNLEIIIIDDGSTDDGATINRLATYERQKHEDRLKVFRQENRGVSAARNTGIKCAHGEYIAFLDSDDLWNPEKLEQQLIEIQAASSDHLKVCGCNVVIRDKNHKGQIIKETTYPKGLSDDIWSALYPSAWLVERRAFDKERVGLFDESIHCAEDHDWRLRFIEQGGQIVIADGQLLEYFSDPDALYRDMAKSMRMTIDKHCSWFIQNDPDHLLHYCDRLRQDKRDFEGKEELINHIKGLYEIAQTAEPHQPALRRTPAQSSAFNRPTGPK